MSIELGLNPWNQAYSWEEAMEVAQIAERLGFDQLWSWEHLLAAMGEPHQDTFDAYTLVTAWAGVTSRVGLGVLTGANTFRNPALLAKMVSTLDHASDGRAILALGAGWHEQEHREFGIEFGTGFGDRLAWLDEAVAAIRGLLDGEAVSSPEGGRYQLRGARLLPPPVQERLPILVGGGGERKTLRTVARYADIWNWAAIEDAALMRHKDSVLRQHCEEVGRDHTEIVRSAFLNPVIRDTEEEAMRFFRVQMEANRLADDSAEGADMHITTPARMTELMEEWIDIGFTSFVLQSASPFDAETMERFAKEIRPKVDRS